MQGKMMTGIADACNEISAVFDRVQKKLKAEALFSEKEHACIHAAFNEILKEGGQCLEQLKKFFSLKQAMEETEKTKLLEQMYRTMKAHCAVAVKFEKGFGLLSRERQQRLENTDEVSELFRGRKRKDGLPKLKREREPITK